MTGLIALLAAWVTARPVWRQLESMTTQSNLLLREFLDQKLIQSTKTYDTISKLASSFQMTFSEGSLKFCEDERINPEWAFNQEASGQQLQKRVGSYSLESLPADEVRPAFINLNTALLDLPETLDRIHRPFSEEQHGEDRSFSDEEWKSVKSVGHKAEADLLRRINKFDCAVREFRSCFSGYIGALKKRASALETEILGAQRL